MAIDFRVTHTDASTSARLGVLTLSRGVEVATPAFMPVGTKGAVKSLSPDEVRGLGYGMILCNAYHLYLRPGHELIRRLGGLHRFMNWNGGILTDSGGYQIFSLAALRKVTAEGVEFRSHVDGSTHFFTPEKSIEVQASLGCDIAVCLDDVVGYPVEKSSAIAAVQRTTEWAKRCVATQKRVDPPLFGIVQGSTFPDLRTQSAEALVSLELDGYAIGGLSVGEPTEEMLQVLETTAPLLPRHLPRYLMGVGTPLDILDAVVRGIDLFDCVLPTRNARNGMLFTSNGRINIRNARYRDDARPVDPECGCALCSKYSRSYLRHLFQEKEIYAHRLASIHNLSYYSNVMRDIRNAIAAGTLSTLYTRFQAETEERDD